MNRLSDKPNGTAVLGILEGCGEVRAATQVGLDTSMKGNLSGAVYAITSIINLGRTFIH
ncbi:conjugal transfer protein TrbL family protein [Caproiciproducens sp.]|uniref:conjugal transfer protein TrbL family protein n=1 Tax=Caproiciproducens sp. TaxID=1954376 RepID=UPI003FA496B2